jgi:hypothetical protein
MTAMAAEGAGSAGAGAGMTAAGAAGSAGNGVLLAIAIILLWITGVLLFVAFEGSSILGESVPAAGGGGASYFKAAIEGLTAKAQSRQGGS